MVSSAWLTKQRKATLIDLAEQASLDMFVYLSLAIFCIHSQLYSDESWLKPDIVEALDAHLQMNETRLSRQSVFEPFFQARRTPHKVRDNSDDSEVKSVVRGRGRRATTSKVKSEPE